jgi:glycyl-tRNA synthetase beta chain
MSAAEFLFELRVEEIPAGFLADATAELKSRIEKALADAGLAEGAIVSVFDTPRRIVVRIANLKIEIPEREIEVTGPPKKAAFREDGTPTPAALGFARTHGVEPSAIRIVKTAKGEYAGLTKTLPAVPTSEILSKAIPAAIASLPWPKTMRWGEGKEIFVRPVHGVVALLGSEIVPMTLFGVESGRTTVGHRATGEATIKLKGGFDDYRQRLAEAGVVVDAVSRRETLVAGCRALADGAASGPGVRYGVHEDESLIETLSHLTEHPGVLLGSIREEFLSLPEEILVTSIREHQKSFVVEKLDAAGAPAGIAPFFLSPMDQVADPVGAIRRGNEWVVAARLSDATFFLAEDRKSSLEAKAPRLARLAFHEKLGSYGEKAARMETLAGWIADSIGLGGERAAASSAAKLAKVDLVTEMVKEFTDLQGIVGGLYAKGEGKPEAEWQAIYDHYRPKSENDPVPRGDAGGIVALADKLDSLAGFFGLGLVPSGSKDPYALRRAAQGVVRILLEKGWNLDLDAASAEAARLYGTKIPASPAEVATRLAPFWQERIRWQLERRGFRYDEIAAVLATGIAPLPDILGRVEALAGRRESADFRSIVLAFKRIQNIVADQPAGGDPDPALFVEKAERLLSEAFHEAKTKADAALASRNYAGALEAVAALAAPLDTFFVDVMVLCEDERVRANRVALLRALSKGFARFAIFSEVVAEREKGKG